MSFVKTTTYVRDAKKAAEYFQAAFGIPLKVVYDNAYAELDTGAVVIAFVTPAQGANHLEGQSLAVPSSSAVNSLLTFTVDDVDATFAQAVAAGGIGVRAPEDREWGQRAAFVRTPDNLVVEISGS